MIVTVTANPSVDRTVELTGELRRGQVLRAAGSQSQPGGKGINVARAVAAAELDVLALLPAADGDPLLNQLDQTGLPYRTIPVSAPVRTNITVVEPDGTTTKINEPGAALTDAAVDALTDQVLAAAQDVGWLALCGSVPPGLPLDWYGRIIGRLAGSGVRTAVDTSGSPLAAAAEAGAALLKPNAEELAWLAGADGAAMEAQAAAGDPSAAVTAAAGLAARTGGAVLTTLGGAGALLTTPEGTWQATAPRIQVRSTVGAGDSSLAGYLIAHSRGAGPEGLLATAVAYGSAAAALPGTTPPTPGQTDPSAVTVRRLS